MRATAVVALILAAGTVMPAVAQQYPPFQVSLKCTPNLAQTTVRDGAQPGLGTLELKGQVPVTDGTAFNLFVINRDTRQVVGEQTVAVTTDGGLSISVPVYKLEAGRYAVGLAKVDGNGVVGRCLFDILRNN